MKEVFVFFMLLFAKFSFAGNGTWTQKHDLQDVVIGLEYNISEPYISNNTTETDFEVYRGLVYLDYTRKEQSDLTQLFPWRIRVKFNYYDQGGQLISDNELEVGSDVDLLSSDYYQYMDYLELSSLTTIDGYTITVMEIEGEYHDGVSWVSVSNPQNNIHFPNDIDFNLELRSEKWFTLENEGVDSEFSEFQFDPSNFRVRWSYVEGAEEYDLEWVFIDDYSNEKQLIDAGYGNSYGYELPFIEKEATSVRIWRTNYSIDKTFTEGTLYFRVRSVGRFKDVNGGILEESRKLGEWTYFATPASFLGSGQYSIGTTVLYEIDASSTHEPERNWTYETKFSEEGKSVSNLSYFDGTNRSRQNLSYNASDNVTMVSDSKYDFEGRQTVNVLPAPIHGRDLSYRHGFNRVSTTNIFNEDDLDFNDYTAHSISLSPGNPQLEESGAAQYFSNLSAFQENLFWESIPNAKGYVYSQTVYRNDGSGRIEKVGGVGEEFQVGGFDHDNNILTPKIDHTIQTFYGSPTLSELKRLFGDNVPDELVGYRKEIVRDQNGQYSVKYYDKRGKVIAQGLSGDAPNNLVALDNQDELDEIVTPLGNNITMGDYSSIAEHTYIPSQENAQITLDYSLNGAIEVINGQTITIGGQNYSIQDLCATCTYDLKIEVIDQNGVHYEASGVSGDFNAIIDAQGNCYDVNGQNSNLTAAQYSTFPNTLPSPDHPSLVYSLGSIQEYRIKKTLSVNLESMISSFQEQLDISGLGDASSFVSIATANIDYSDCYSDCDQYCEELNRFEYDQEYGINAWDALTPSEKQPYLDACSSEYCSEDNLYDDFLNETGNNQNPFEQSCVGYFDLMVDQITPGGIFYEDLNSWFWSNLPDPATTSNNPSGYTHAQLQDPNFITDEIAEELILEGYHRESCHYLLCYDNQEVMLYSAEFGTEIADLPTTFDNSSTLLSTPYSIPTTSYTQDPFLMQPWNSNGELQAAISDYLGYINFSTGDIANINALCSDPVGNSLYDYVLALVDCMQAIDQQGTNSLVDYDQVAKLTFVSLYNDLVINLINDYKESITCEYFDDENAIFKTLGGEQDVEELISEILASISNGTSCEEMAFNNATEWVEDLSVECTNVLISEGFLSTMPFSQNSLVQNSDAGTTTNSNSTLEQLFYDYTLETCPSNTWGWFYDPTGIHTLAEDEYDAILDILSDPLVSQECGASEIESFIIDPAPTIIGMGVTNQTLPNCTQEYLEMINDGLSSLNNLINSTNPTLPLCPIAYGGAYGVTISVDNTNYPELASTNCNLSGDYEFWLCKDGSGNIYNNFNAVGNACALTFSSVPDENSQILNLDSYIVSFSNPVKFASYTMPNGNTVPDILLIDVTYANGSTGQIYINNDNCLDLGDFTEQTILSFNLPEVDEEQIVEDCRDQTLAAAQIDALIEYNGLLAELENQLAVVMGNCLENTSEIFQMTYDLKEYQYTLYYYDLAGNLVQTVPPQGVNPTNVSYDVNGLWTGGNPDHKMETRYKYNGLNSLLAQFTPDEGHTDFILDDLYRVRFSRNARQLSNNMASYIKYDDLGRLIEAGEFMDYPNIVEDNVGTPAVNEALVYLKAKALDQNYPEVGVQSVLDYTHTFYEVGFITDPTIAAQFEDGEQKNLRNVIGAIYQRQLIYETDGAIVPGSEVESVVSYSYDVHKSVKQFLSTNYHLEGIGHHHKLTEYSYDLISRVVNEIKYQEGQTDEYRYSFHFDDLNRLVRSYSSQDAGITWDMDAKYFYHLHGPLARVEIGQDEIQGVDYAYNTQGWLKGINSNTLTAENDLGRDANLGDNEFFGIDAFGVGLGYYKNDYEPIGTITPFASTLIAADLNLNDESGPQFGNLMSELFTGTNTHMVTAMRDNSEDILDVLLNNYRFDQAGRIKAMDVYFDVNAVTNNNFDGAELYDPFGGGGNAFRTRYSYDANGNLISLLRNGSGSENYNGEYIMDDFTYYYDNGSGGLTTSTTEVNRLLSVTDNVSTSSGIPASGEENYSNDLNDDHSSSVANYVYNESGQLIQDTEEDIEEIIWSVSGKMKEIRYTALSGKSDIRFIYDALDMRIGKIVYASCNSMVSTFYSYDSQGNLIATYELNQDAPSDGEPWEVSGMVEYFTLKENILYGASRLGLDNRNLLLYQGDVSVPATPYQTTDLCINTDFLVRGYQENLDYSFSQLRRGKKRYELTNHLGNILEVITDRKLPKQVIINSVTKTVYTANVISYSDYYPFGMLMPSRYGNSEESYKYGYNGMEKDDEIKGNGNSYTTPLRQLDTRIARWLTTDPIVHHHQSPYSSHNNNPIRYTDVSGGTGNDWVELLKALPGANGETVYVRYYKWHDKAVSQRSAEIIFQSPYIVKATWLDLSGGKEFSYITRSPGELTLVHLSNDYISANKNFRFTAYSMVPPKAQAVTRLGIHYGWYEDFSPKGNIINKWAGKSVFGSDPFETISSVEWDGDDVSFIAAVPVYTMLIFSTGGAATTVAPGATGIFSNFLARSTLSNATKAYLRQSLLDGSANFAGDFFSQLVSNDFNLSEYDVFDGGVSFASGFIPGKGNVANVYKSGISAALSTGVDININGEVTTAMDKSWTRIGVEFGTGFVGNLGGGAFGDGFIPNTVGGFVVGTPTSILNDVILNEVE